MRTPCKVARPLGHHPVAGASHGRYGALAIASSRAAVTGRALPGPGAPLTLVAKAAVPDTPVEVPEQTGMRR
jgi:hypothetical protein